MSNRFPNPSVYGAGPITGQDYEGATVWREYAREKFAEDGIVFFSPMRAKEYLQEEQVLRGDPQAYIGTGLSNPKGIVTRDRFDTRTADLVLVNLLPAEERMRQDRELARLLIATMVFADAQGGQAPGADKLIALVDRLAARGNTSIGTMIELGWSDGFRTPTVVCMTPENPHYHAMVAEIAGYVVEDLDSGIAMAKAILLPGRRASEAYAAANFQHVLEE